MDENTAVLRARRFLKDHNVTSAPVDVTTLAQAEGFEVKLRELPEGEAGSTLERRGKPYILVNQLDPPMRQRFTILHEIAHHVLRLPSVHGQASAPHGTAPPNSAKRPSEEVACDAFASECLVPLALVKPLIEGQPLADWSSQLLRRLLRAHCDKDRRPFTIIGQDRCGRYEESLALSFITSTCTVAQRAILMSRDNFSQPVKIALARRAGERCSFPDCDAVTVGPSSESSVATANTGNAAHIAAASDGINSRRYDPNMTPAQRSAIENGIWCCATHAVLIDKDEVTYTVEMLTQWRALAERRAQLRQAHGNIDLSPHLVDLGLAPDVLPLANDADINVKVGTAVQHSWLANICGIQTAHTLRDFIIEHARNAFEHGGATLVNVAIQTSSIEIEDDGAPFSITSLVGPTGRGGALAYDALLQSKLLGHAASQRLTNGRNVVHIPFVREPGKLPSVNPCAISLSHQSLRSGETDFTQLLGCDHVYIIAPDYSTYSDASLYERALQQVFREHRNVTLIFPAVSEGVLTRYRSIFGQVKVETW